MDQIRKFDKLVSEKAFKVCIDKGYTKYSEIAILLDTSDSFVKAVFSEHRKKLNLYHLVKLSYELNCPITHFLPDLNDYRKNYNSDDEYECFIKSITEE